MLNLEELFKKRPFIYYISGEYYAFGARVCSKCNANIYITLPQRYKEYSECLQSDIDNNTAWRVFYGLSIVAESVKNNSNPNNLEIQFEELKLSDKEKEDIAKQLNVLVEFFYTHNLKQFYC